MSRILLVEDDYALAMGTEYTLKAEGYDVTIAKNLHMAREVLGIEKDSSLSNDLDNLNESEKSIDIILLDVMLPDGDGFSFMEELSREEISIPVIFSTAVGDEANIVRGLDLGADDYITKPYRVKELLARIAAVIRRQEKAMRLAKKAFGNSNEEEDFIFGNHRFSTRSFRLFYKFDKGEEEVSCTPAELRLLRELIKNYGIVLTRNQLLERLYDSDSSFVDDNTLSVYMKRLRDKLGEDALFIKTVKGIGYRFEK
ncbi:MAG: response regulator transcription factor [Eubacterium sp.]|nr:response regulator transcription factor [Eubacterium sp.]